VSLVAAGRHACWTSQQEPLGQRLRDNYRRLRLRRSGRSRPWRWPRTPPGTLRNDIRQLPLAQRCACRRLCHSRQCNEPQRSFLGAKGRWPQLWHCYEHGDEHLSPRTPYLILQEYIWRGDELNTVFTALNSLHGNGTTPLNMTANVDTFVAAPAISETEPIIFWQFAFRGTAKEAAKYLAPSMQLHP
jgi:hypothetical protein